MKKLKLNSTLNHKQSEYNTHEVIVEKVITLYGNHFSELKNHTLDDDPYIAEKYNPKQRQKLPCRQKQSLQQL